MVAHKHSVRRKPYVSKGSDRKDVPIPTSSCACSNEAWRREPVGVSIAPWVRIKLMWAMPCSTYGWGRARPFREAGTYQYTKGKLRQAPREGSIWRYNVLVIWLPCCSVRLQARRGYRRDGQIMESIAFLARCQGTHPLLICSPHRSAFVWSTVTCASIFPSRACVTPTTLIASDTSWRVMMTGSPLRTGIVNVPGCEAEEVSAQHGYSSCGSVSRHFLSFFNFNTPTLTRTRQIGSDILYGGMKMPL
jgi:hypothetical protein